jgi:hypothetical protein
MQPDGDPAPSQPVTAPLPAVSTLQEFFAILRLREPEPDETVRMTIVGLPHGSLRRTTQRQLAFMTLTMLALILGTEWRREPLGIAVIVMTVFIVPAVAAQRTRPAGDLPLGVMVSDRRVVVAQQRRRAEPEIRRRLPAESASRITVADEVDERWNPGVKRVTVSGSMSDVVTLDIAGIDRTALLAVLRESGLTLSADWLDDDAIARGDLAATQSSVESNQPRFWVLRAFPAGLLYTIGVGTGLLAVLAPSQTATQRVVALAIGIFAILAGDLVRRVLLRSRARDRGRVEAI